MAQIKSCPGLKEKLKNFIPNKNQLGFQENKGQMADDSGNPVPFVLFKAEAPNLNIWITNTGLTYQLFRLEEKQEKKDLEKHLENSMKDEKTEGEWHRVDMVLKGVNIKKENSITENDITQGDVRYYLGHCSSGYI